MRINQNGFDLEDHHGSRKSTMKLVYTPDLLSEAEEIIEGGDNPIFFLLLVVSVYSTQIAKGFVLFCELIGEKVNQKALNSLSCQTAIQNHKKQWVN